MFSVMTFVFGAAVGIVFLFSFLWYAYERAESHGYLNKAFEEKPAEMVMAIVKEVLTALRLRERPSWWPKPSPEIPAKAEVRLPVWIKWGGISSLIAAYIVAVIFFAEKVMIVFCIPGAVFYYVGRPIAHLFGIGDDAWGIVSYILALFVWIAIGRFLNMLWVIYALRLRAKLSGSDASGEQIAVDEANAAQQVEEKP